MVKKGKWENRHERFYSHRKSWILRAGYLYPRYNKRIIKDFHHRQVDENPWICTLSRVVYKQRHYTLRTRARGIAGACTIIPRCLSNVCVRSIYVYTYIYRYVCIYVYIYIYTSVWPLGEYEAAFLVLRRKDRDEGHTKASPWIPLVVENYISCRVADPWIGFWVSAYPRDMFTSLASSPSHSSSFYYSLSLLLTSSHVDFSIPSYLRLFFRSWNSWELFREREKKRKKSFDFRSLSKGNFSPLSLRFHATPSSRLLSLTSPFFVPPFFLGMAPTRASSCCGWLLIWLTDLCISLLSYYASSSPYLHMQIEQAYLRPPPIHPLL